VDILSCGNGRNTLLKTGKLKKTLKIDTGKQFYLEHKIKINNNHFFYFYYLTNYDYF